MSQEEKSAYYSVRMRMGDVTSPKDLIGTKDFTVEITMGNQDALVIRDKADVAKIENKSVFDLVEDLFVQRDEWNKKPNRGYKFVDQISKEESK